MIKKTLPIILSLFLLIGCTSQVNSSKKISSISGNLKYLTSSKLDGRLTGTKENQMVEKYIAKQFKDIGLNEYEDGTYFQKYTHDFYDPKTQINELTMKFTDGLEKKYKYGEDFMPSNRAEKLELNMPVTTDINDENLNKSFILLSDSKDISKVLGKAGGILIKTEDFSKTLRVEKDIKANIQINNSLYEELKTKKANAHLNQRYELTKIEANNVIGKIKGNDSSKAIVISAHFDHVGSASNKIYTGAIDNASGVAVLLNVASELKKKSQDKQLETDIIICALNGEDSGRQGSKSFSKVIKNTYKELININLDCLGIKDGGDLMLTAAKDEVNKTALNDISGYLKENGYNSSIIDDSSMESDDFSFSELEIPAFTIAQKNISKIHTIKDEIGTIDVDYIKSISEILSKYIVVASNRFGELNKNIEIKKTSSEDMKKEEEQYLKDKIIIDEELKKMEFGNYKFITIDKRTIMAYKSNATFKTIEELKKCIKDINIPENLGKFNFKEVGVTLNNKIINRKSEDNKIYTPNIKQDNVQIISIKYESPIEKNNIINFVITRDEEGKIINLIKEFYKNQKSDDEIFNINGNSYDVLYRKIDDTVSLLCKPYKSLNSQYVVEISYRNEEPIESSRGNSYKTTDILKRGVNSNLKEFMESIDIDGALKIIVP